MWDFSDFFLSSRRLSRQDMSPGHINQQNSENIQHTTYHPLPAKHRYIDGLMENYIEFKKVDKSSYYCI